MTAASPAPVALTVDRFDAVPEAGITESARPGNGDHPAANRGQKRGPRGRRGLLPLHRERRRGSRRCQAVASELGSKLDPALVLYDDNGSTLERKERAFATRRRKTGTYAISVRDKEYRGGSDFTYRLHIGNVPVITGVFPLAVQRGTDDERPREWREPRTGCEWPSRRK